jgi:hypothetical protein
MRATGIVYPSLEEVKGLLALPSSAGKNLVPIVKDLKADLETPVSAFLKGTCLCMSMCQMIPEWVKVMYMLLIL